MGAAKSDDLFPDLRNREGTRIINERWLIKTQDEHRVVLVPGIVLAQYWLTDHMAEAYAMVNLVEQGWATQLDVARAFHCCARTVHRAVDGSERLKARGHSNREIARRAGVMKTEIFTLLVVVASLQCWADPPLGEARVVIGQPSIFWHNGQWQTYNDGVWTPYGKPMSNGFAQPRSKEDATYSGPGIRDLGVARRAALRKSASLRRGSNAGIGKTTIGVGQANAIGQSASGIGEPNVGIGRSTIGIGQPSAGIGQPNGIGQTTIGIGKPNVSIGRSTIGIGQPNTGIGQPNAMGQTTIGIGKPASFPNQQRSPLLAFPPRSTPS